MRRCEHDEIRFEAVSFESIKGCEDVKMRSLDVKVRKCEMRRCEEAEKRWEGVKMRRCQDGRM